MEKEIEKVIRETLVIENKKGVKYAVRRISNLFSIRLSQLEESNKKLKFIIENGLGEKDFENDCT